MSNKLLLILSVVLSLPASAQEAQTCSAPGKLSLVPISGTHTLASYSRKAVSENDEGRVWLRIDVASDGKVDDVIVVRSSGAAELDRLASEHVKSHWLYEPPLFDCKPTKAETWTYEDFYFKEKLESPHGPDFIVRAGPMEYPPEKYSEFGSATFTVNLSDDGIAQDIHLDNGTGFADLDDIANKVVRNRTFRKIGASAQVTVEVDMMPSPQAKP